MTAAPARAFAPGRCTVVGEHVDYADGVVVCMAVHLGVTVTVAQSGAVDDAPGLTGATLQSLRDSGWDVPPLRVTTSATLPSGAGLSSSAAVCCGTAAAALRLIGVRVAARELCDMALHAERDIAGVPCGALDQRAVVLAPPGGALVLDFQSGGVGTVRWPDGHVLAACHTGDTHDVGGEGYRERRAQAGNALAVIGAASWRDVRAEQVDWLVGRDRLLGLRARHIVAETARALECAEALRRGDAEAVGALMSASHVSLRDDYEVSTGALDAVVAAAEMTPGCRGARLVGAGFGGTAVALVDEDHARACLDAMHAAAPGGRGAWILRPSPGLAALAPDVVA